MFAASSEERRRDEAPLSGGRDVTRLGSKRTPRAAGAMFPPLSRDPVFRRTPVFGDGALPPLELPRLTGASDGPRLTAPTLWTPTSIRTAEGPPAQRLKEICLDALRFGSSLNLPGKSDSFTAARRKDKKFLAVKKAGAALSRAEQRDLQLRGVRPGEAGSESLLWAELQEVPFFRDFRLRRAFSRWRGNVRRLCFQRRCVDLQASLLTAVPLFRDALLLLNRAIEELKATRRLPQEETRSFTLLELKDQLVTRSGELLQALEKFCRHRAAILNSVREEAYAAHRDLQLHAAYAQRPGEVSEPIHLHRAHQQQLEEQLSRARAVLHRLGDFAALADAMVVQSLVAVVQQDAAWFLSGGSERRRCLFHTQLRLRADGQLTVEPAVRLFHQAVSDAVLSAGDAVIQMCDSCGLFLELGGGVSSSGAACDERPVISAPGCTELCCWTFVRELPSYWMAAETRPLLQSDALHCCYSPLSRKQLEWHVGISGVPEQVAREQAAILQEAEAEAQQLCESLSWLADAHLFAGQWSAASLASLRGQPAALYEELVEKLQRWSRGALRLPSISSTSSTCTRLLLVQSSGVTEGLEKQLSLMEDQVLQQLAEEIQLRSQSVTSDLDRGAAQLRAEPYDLQDLSTYAAMVRQSVKTLPKTQERLEYLRSLQETLSRNYRKPTEQEVAVEEKMQDAWSHFLSLLEHADRLVCRRLPSGANAMDAMFSFLLSDLKSAVSKATSGPFLDPTQNATETLARLKHACAHVHGLRAKLEQLSRNSQNLQEQPMDLTILTTEVQKVEARKDLWELKAWMEEWTQLLLGEDAVSRAQSKLSEWKDRAQALTGAVPTHDAVLQETVRTLDGFSRQLCFLAELQSSALKQKHWRAVYQAVGLRYDPDSEATPTALMSERFELHHKPIQQICQEARAERSVEQSFQTLRQRWEGRLVQLEVFSRPDWLHGEQRREVTEAEQRMVAGLDELSADIESDLMSLAAMLASPHSADCRLEMGHWLHSLQELEKLLCLFGRHQQMWAFLTQMFHGSFSAQTADLVERFQPVEETFKEIMSSISKDPRVLQLVRSTQTDDGFHGDRLYLTLTEGLATMEGLSNKMADLLDDVCNQFPRLWFLSHREVTQLLSCRPTPPTLQPVVRKCFSGVRRLQVDHQTLSETKEAGPTPQTHAQPRVLGVYGDHQELVAFLTPVEPDAKVLVWLCAFEKQLRSAVARHLERCAAALESPRPDSADLLCHVGDRRRVPLPVLGLLPDQPLQCLLLAEQAAWHKAVRHALQQPRPAALTSIREHNAAKLETLVRSIRGAGGEALVSKRTMMCLRALVELTMNQARLLLRLLEVQFAPLSSFEWLSLMKYHVGGADGPLCCVEVLNHRLQYDYEYCGPEDWVLVHTPPTDRAALGILLALTSYRCGFVSGPGLSGKKKTAVQLGKALGRQVVGVRCAPGTTARVLQRGLLGALHSGAWLLLDSVESLPPGVLSVLGQHLSDIHQSLCELTRSKDPGSGSPDGSPDGVRGHMVFVGKSLCPSLSYGCVVTSAEERSSELPDGLRWASRPVALTRPDYRVIAEVMLTSVGFSEAGSLSRHLASLLRLAQDSLCLPEFLADRRSCYVVILQKIVSAAEVLFQQSAREREASEEAGGKFPGLRSYQLSIIQAVMEETAVVKAVLSVLLPLLQEDRKASAFSAIFKEAFPLAPQFPRFQQSLHEEEQNRLAAAVTEELQRERLHGDTETLRNALRLHQTLRASQAVLLIGPPGSGKTTCYRAVAGALNRLAAGRTASRWTPVHAVVLFPNAMSHQELFGFFCGNRGWQDGAVAKVLRDAERREALSGRDSAAAWLVMDGSPVGRPGWLDHLAALCCPGDPCLRLWSGETPPRPSSLRLLVETSDLGDATPSAVSRCSLLYLGAADQWKSVWTSAAAALAREHKLDQTGVPRTWSRLAEDLFSQTLSSMRENALTLAVGEEGASSAGLRGILEVASFTRILRALLQQFGREVAKAETADSRADVLTEPQLLARNLFLVAYVWGFSGHLHPRHWSQFDLLARQLLFTCRYKIQVPDEESVFDHFLSIDSRMCPRNTLVTTSISPKYGKHTFLLSLLLEANQPVLLAGEPGSGKSRLCKTLLDFHRPHVSLPGSPLLGSGDLRTVFQNISTDGTGATEKRRRTLLFVDDLHEAPCDVGGKASAALETLRQSVSTGRILTFDSHHLKSLSSASVGCLATCGVVGSGRHHGDVISARLWRLFSVLVLPSLSVDVLLSIHAPRLQPWLRDAALECGAEDMACSVVTATHSLYHAVRQRFQPTEQKPHFLFSHHDLHKVFTGMCLWRPSVAPPTRTGNTALDLSVVRLWMHECMRTFGDRLAPEDERQTLASLLVQTAAAHYGTRWADGAPPTAAGHSLQTVTQLVYGPDLSAALSSAVRLHELQYRCYEGGELDALLPALCALADRKRAAANQAVGYAAHRQNLRQLLGVLRALLLPGGHALLLAAGRGGGRRATVRLAAGVVRCPLMEVHRGNEDQLHRILREAANQTRAEGVGAALLVHQDVGAAAREELLVAMAHGTYPALHPGQELGRRVAMATAAGNSRRFLTDSRRFEKYLSQIHRNVHVFLLLPVTTATSGCNAQLLKALRLCHSVEFYPPWTSCSLQEVAARRLRSSESPLRSASCSAACVGLSGSLPVAMAGIHQSACRYASVLLSSQPFSPRTYMEFIAHFGFYGNQLQERRQRQADRLGAALSHVDAMNAAAVQSERRLAALREKVAETQQLEAELLGAVELQRKQLQEAQEACSAEEKQLEQLEEQIHQAEEQVRPVFLSALHILSCLKPCDLEEVRRYRNPPDGVVRVMDAVCLLFNRPAGWENAKQLLAQDNLYEEFEFFDRYSVTDEQLQQLGRLVGVAQFEPESVREVSRACESLCRWVQAVHRCCCQQRRLRAGPRLLLLAREARARLQLAQRGGREALRRLGDAQLHLQLVQKEREELQLDLHSAERAERENAAAAGLLETHISEWRAAAQELSHQTWPGDALILAAIASYSGPFGPDVRTELLGKWKQLCETGSTDTTPDDPRTPLFTQPEAEAQPADPRLGFPIPVSERLHLPVGQILGTQGQTQGQTLGTLGTLGGPPRDALLKLLLWGSRRPWVQCWPLLADAQQHLDLSCGSGRLTGEAPTPQKEAESDLVVCADDPELLGLLDEGAEKGLRVLVTHVERATPSPRLLSLLERPPGSNPHADFCLVLSTALPVQQLSSGIHPSLLARVGVVDLSLSSEEVQELLLTQLLQPECEELLSRRSRLRNDKESLQKELISEEEALLDDVLQCKTALLQDADFLRRAAARRAGVAALKAEIQQVSEELQEHGCLLAAPRQLARLAATLHRALQEVSRLSASYHFSLRGFVAVIQEAFIVKGGSLVPRTAGKAPDGVIAEASHRMVARVLGGYRPRLTRSHGAVLKLLVSVALLQQQQLCSGAEGAGLLRGLQDVQLPRAPPPAPPPSWIPAHLHPELLHLDRVPAFRGLMASLSASPLQWQEYLRLPPPSSVTGPVPIRSHRHLSLLQRALLWKAALPECVEGLADAMAVCAPFLPGLTAAGGAPHAGDPEALSRYVVKHEGPVILRSAGPGAGSVKPLHLIRSLADRKQVQVKVLTYGAVSDADVLAWLDAAESDGHWLVFNDCHLWERWDGELVSRLSRTLSSPRGPAHPAEERRRHACFRLWFITGGHAPPSVPAAVRPVAMTLVCDALWDLSEELSCSLRQAAAFARADGKLLLLLRCAVFHSVLLQRQTWKCPGRGRSYSWSQDDLLALMDGLVSMASLCGDEAAALQRVAVDLVHGAHVGDAADLEEVQSAAQACFGAAGPLLLSDLITRHGRRGWTELLAALEPGRRVSADINEPAALGFSADGVAEMTRVRSLELNALLQASQTPLGSQRRPEPASLPVRDRLQRLKSLLVGGAYAAPHSPLRDFLQAEWDDLIGSASSLASPFAPPPELAHLSHLERRAELLAAYLWHAGAPDPPGAYRLSAFRNARGFLAALRLQAAHVNRKTTSDIVLDFQVLGDAAPLAPPPLHAVYLCGLELRGASWDMQQGALQAPAPLQPAFLPLVCVTAQVRNMAAAAGPAPSASALPLYRCPVETQRRGASGEALEAVAALPLPTKLLPVLCSLRNVKLVSRI